MGNEEEMFNYAQAALVGLRAFAKSNKGVEEAASTLYSWLIVIPQKSHKEFLPLATAVTTHYLLASCAPANTTAQVGFGDVIKGLSVGENAGRKAAARIKAQRLADLFGLKFKALEEKI